MEKRFEFMKFRLDDWWGFSIALLRRGRWSCSPMSCDYLFSVRFGYWALQVGINRFGKDDISKVME